MFNAPHCDLTNGKIYGCDKGSFKWWHEKGHFAFNNNEKLSLLILIRGYIKDIWIFFIMAAIIIKQFIYLALLFFTIYFLIWCYEEYWCNKYARKHYKPKTI